MLRKQIFKVPPGPTRNPDEIDVPVTATVLITSESGEHPIDNAFDGRRGPGASRWVASESGEQSLILVFDAPQNLRHITLEVEEQEVCRRQEIEVAVSADGGQTYRELLRQEYNFSPPGTTFELEEWSVRAEGTTHLRLQIKPDKGELPCRATLTSLVLR